MNLNFKEPATGKVKRFYGTKATYTNPTDSVLQICVSGKDILPKISQIKVSIVQEPIQLKTPGFRSCTYNQETRIAKLISNLIQHQRM